MKRELAVGIGVMLAAAIASADTLTVGASDILGVNRRVSGSPVGDVGTFTNGANAVGSPDGVFMTCDTTGAVASATAGYRISFAASTGLSVTDQENINSITVRTTYRTTETFNIYGVAAFCNDSGGMPETNLADFGVGISVGSSQPLNSQDFPFVTDGATGTKTHEITITPDNLGSGDFTSFFEPAAKADGDFVGALWVVDLPPPGTNADWNFEIDSIELVIDYTPGTAPPVDPIPSVPSGAPVAGLLGLSLLAAGLGLAGAAGLRKGRSN
jgi:hypothetical protein